MATEYATNCCVSCPYCADDEAHITLDLNDLAECHCSGCDATFSPKVARDLVAAELAKWEKVIAWIELAPTA